MENDLGKVSQTKNFLHWRHYKIHLLELNHHQLTFCSSCDINGHLSPGKKKQLDLMTIFREQKITERTHFSSALLRYDFRNMRIKWRTKIFFLYFLKEDFILKIVRVRSIFRGKC